MNLEKPIDAIPGITKEALLKLPLCKYEGPVEVIDSDRKLREHLAEIKKSDVLGFDTESRPSFERGKQYPISLIQIATAQKVYIIQIAKLGASRGALFRVFSQKKPIKTGIAVHDDIKKLQEIYPFQPEGFIEIGKLSQEYGLQQTGLRNLAALFFGFRISKSAQVSNWSNSVLDRKQIDYAATDAWVARRVYFYLESLMEKSER